MRADQFILLEYDRSKTIQALGNKLLIALAKTQPYHLPDHLYGASALVATALYPAKYAQNRDVVMDIVGKMAAFSSLNAPEVLEKFKEPILTALLSVIEEQDPTPHKEYTPWLARVWAAAEGNLKLEDLNRGNIVMAFHVGKRKRKIKPEHSDIGKFRSYKEFEDTIYNYNVYELLGIQDPDEDPGNYEVVYNDGSIVRVIVPLDQQAACHFGNPPGSVPTEREWCTATRTGKNYFDYYNSRGKLYIILPYNPEHLNERYQLHFETEQFKDENDDDIDLSAMLRKYPGLEEFFVRQIPELKKYIAFIKNDTLTEIMKLIAPRALDNAWSVVNEWASNDESWLDWQANQAIELGYVTDEGDIDWDRVNENDNLSNYAKYHDDARNFINDVKSISNLTGKTIKNLTTDYVQYGLSPENMPTISLLPYILIYYFNDQPATKYSLQTVFFNFSFYDSHHWNNMITVNNKVKKNFEKIGEIDDIVILSRTDMER